MNNFNDLVRAHVKVYCPECRSELHFIGITTSVFWCNRCEQVYEFKLIKNNKMSKDHIQIRNVVGFPK